MGRVLGLILTHMRRESDHRSDRHNAGGIDIDVSLIVMALNMVEVDRFSDAVLLVTLTWVSPYLKA